MLLYTYIQPMNGFELKRPGISWEKADHGYSVF